MSGNEPIDDLDLRGYSVKVANNPPQGWYFEAFDTTGERIDGDVLFGQSSDDELHFDNREQAEDAALETITEHWLQNQPVDGETLKMRVLKRSREVPVT